VDIERLGKREDGEPEDRGLEDNDGEEEEEAHGSGASKPRFRWLLHGGVEGKSGDDEDA
jgi:hypothetical protein